ncbi:MAG: HlyD family type I secretion periplasmic adaptor subunit [Alphaproteobacteria bacterium]|nr:HlyD family type I secretion periplasmic adaptor subunit [Alphaproteobacteria bacterium]MBF0250125.1 HlyD family type I secretion periplasmic adaptor subunit [Alphaproteobacteria bacterium]
MSKRPQPTAPDGKPELDIERHTHAFLVLLSGALLAFVLWAALGRLDVVSFAVGEVVPSSQVKTVQHLEGGIVADIMVREGDRVQKGQPLVALESTASGADVEELNVRIWALTADVARLEAELAGTDIVYPEGFADAHPDMVDEARQTFETRRRQFENDLAAQSALLDQRLRERDEIVARLANTEERLKLLDEQVKISEELLKDDLTNRMLHLNLLKELANLRGQMSEDGAASQRLDAAIAEERAKLEITTSQFKVEARKQLDQQRRSLNEFQNRVRKYQDSFQRAVITSPVDGVVMTLHVVTHGGVIAPGGAVADIVPVGDTLVVEAKLAPQDVGFVHGGQPARIKLASSDGSRFSAIDGEVVQVSPDTVQNKDGQSFYKVRIRTERDYFESKDQRYQLVPGVEVMCSIVTGTRSVMEYIAGPLMAGFSTAMQER